MSAERRRDDRRARLVAAGLQVIGTQGWAKTSVRQICRTAALTERYFYESFSDREAVLLAVFEAVAQECTHAVLTAYAAAADDSRDKLRAAIGAAFEVLTDDPRKGRVLLLETGSDERLQQRRQQLAVSSAALLADITRHHFERELDRVDLDLTALAVVGAQTQLVTAWLSGSVEVSRDRLIEHLIELHMASRLVSSLPSLRPRKATS
jgi:AcrR family transcriptional regulator